MPAGRQNKKPPHNFQDEEPRVDTDDHVREIMVFLALRDMARFAQDVVDAMNFLEMHPDVPHQIFFPQPERPGAMFVRPAQPGGNLPAEALRLQRRLAMGAGPLLPDPAEDLARAPPRDLPPLPALIEMPDPGLVEASGPGAGPAWVPDPGAGPSWAPDPGAGPSWAPDPVAYPSLAMDSDSTPSPPADVGSSGSSETGADPSLLTAVSRSRSTQAGTDPVVSAEVESMEADADPSGLEDTGLSGSEGAGPPGSKDPEGRQSRRSSKNEEVVRRLTAGVQAIQPTFTGTVTRRRASAISELEKDIPAHVKRSRLEESETGSAEQSIEASKSMEIGSDSSGSIEDK